MTSPIIKMYRGDKTVIVDSREEKTVQDFIDIGFSKNKLVPKQTSKVKSKKVKVD